jgi:hypothetical protein
MNKLLPSTQAVLTAVTQNEYSLDPDDIPMEAGRMASVIAVALRAAVDQVVPEEGDPIYGLTPTGADRQVVRRKFLAIAAELDNSSNTSEGIMATNQPVPVRTPDELAQGHSIGAPDIL